MKIARWIEQTTDEMEYSPKLYLWMYFLRCLAWFFGAYAACMDAVADSAALLFVCRCYDRLRRRFYLCKAWFFAKKAACLYAYADALEAWGRSRRRAKIRRRLKQRIAGSGKGAQRG
jgi:hypothetical protein